MRRPGDDPASIQLGPCRDAAGLGEGEADAMTTNASTITVTRRMADQIGSFRRPKSMPSRKKNRKLSSPSMDCGLRYSRGTTTIPISLS